MASVALLALAGCGGSGKENKEKAAEEVAVVNEMDAQHADVTNNGIKPSNGLPMIVDFSAVWCPPCQKLKPIFASLKTEYSGKVDFVTVDVDSMPDLATQYGIESIPALVYLTPDGKEVYRSVGFREADSIKSDIAKWF